LARTAAAGRRRYRHVAIIVDNVNDPPVNSVPATQPLNQDTILVFSTANGNAISVADPDAGGSVLQVDLSASQGVLT
jgi:hypothetical protein